MHSTSFLKEKKVCFTHLTCQNLFQLKRTGVLDTTTSQIFKDSVCNDEMNIASSPVCTMWYYDTKQTWANGRANIHDRFRASTGK